jgi:hypothetical protein
MKLILALAAAAAAAAPLRAQSDASSEISASTAAPAESQASAEDAVKDWPEGPRLIARAMIEKYGRPARVSENSVAWFSSGSWDKIVVHRRGWPRVLGMRDRNYLEQAISYTVPDDKLEDLKRFDRRVAYDKAAGELSARSDDERLNFLALNLADEIVKDRRTVSDAKDFMRKTESLARAGKSSPYLDGFVFTVHSDKSAEPDTSGALNPPGEKPADSIDATSDAPPRNPEPPAPGSLTSPQTPNPEAPPSTPSEPVETPTP